MRRVFEPLSTETERFAKIAVDAALRVHTALGPGLLESVYETCLAHELRKRGLAVETQSRFQSFTLVFVSKRVCASMC